MADITMPQLGETVVEGTIIKWFKKVGDPVARDEALFEVSTDKVDSEVPSVAEGFVAEILVDEGQTVDVGTRLAVVTEAQPAAGSSPTPAPGNGTAEPTAGDNGDKSARATSTGATAAEPVEAALAESVPAEPAPVESVPVEAALVENQADVAQGEGADGDSGGGAGAVNGGRPAAPAARPEGGAALLSPVVRRLIAEHDLDAADIPGTGQGGRVTRADVLSFIDQGAAAAKQGPKPAESAPAPRRQAGATAATRAPLRPGDDDLVVPFSNIRRRTAEHMVRSQATSAHVLIVTEVDFAAVDRVRLPVRETFKAKEGFSLTYLPFVSRAVVDAIAEFPDVNASVGDNTLIVHQRVHLGFAVDLAHEGLIVPVVRDAHGKRLSAIARDLAALAARARSHDLTADEISGGTFTITNPGPFGTFLTAPVINHPQVAILSTDGVRKRPVAIELPDGSDAVAIHPVGNLALSFDHRAFDGAYASAFLGQCRQILETRDWSQEL
ncbi:MAG: dihydrolipoamide acetyltransferase family protein [Acidimicrobiales bacterium]